MRNAVKTAMAMSRVGTRVEMRADSELLPPPL